MLYVCDIREFGYVCNIREFWCVVTLIRKEKGHIVSSRYVTLYIHSPSKMPCTIAHILVAGHMPG